MGHTSLAWSAAEPSRAISGQSDGRVACWDLKQEMCAMQVRAHNEGPCLGVAFSSDEDDRHFATVGGDATLRIFDTRNIGQSMVLFETTSPLLRVAFNEVQPNLAATYARDSPGVTVLDMRKPGSPLLHLEYRDPHVGSSAVVTAASWHPKSNKHLACGTDAGSVLIWNLSTVSADRQAPQLVYEAADWEVQQVDWPRSNPGAVAIGLPKHV